MDRSNQTEPVLRGPRRDRSVAEAYLEGDATAHGDVERWIQVEIRRTYPRLAGEVEDLCQSVHLRLWNSLTAGRFAGRSSLRSYVTGIVHHVAIDRLRQLYAERALTESLADEQGVEWPNPYRGIEAAVEDRRVHQLIQALPAPCLELWRMVFLEKLGYEEIARRLGIPAGTVKSRRWHCRQKAQAAFRRLRGS
jgi:RNA polymerase sigma factor (sigma-70 family)